VSRSGQVGEGGVGKGSEVGEEDRGGERGCGGKIGERSGRVGREGCKRGE